MSTDPAQFDIQIGLTPKLISPGRARPRYDHLPFTKVLMPTSFIREERIAALTH